MDVEPFVERGLQVLIAAHVGDHAQFDLAVVGAQQQVLVAARYEGLSDLAPLLGADGDVLQVGLVAGQAACGRHRLAEIGMDAPCDGVHLPRKRIDIGALQLLQLAVFQDGLHDGMGVLQRAQHILAGGVLARARLLRRLADPQLFEQDLAQLPGRVEIETHPGQFHDPFIEREQFLVQFPAERLQHAHIERDTLPLHVGQYAGERHLDPQEELLQLVLLQSGQEHLLQLPGDVRILRAVLFHRLQIGLAHGAQGLVLRSDQGFNAHRPVLQEGLGEEIHVVLQLGLQQVVGHHGIEHGSLDVHAVAAHHLHVVLQVLRHLFLRRVLQQRLEDAHHLSGFGRVLGHHHVVAGMLLPAEGHAHEVRRMLVQAGGLRIEAERGLLLELGREHVHAFARVHKMVRVRGGGDGGEVAQFDLGLLRVRSGTGEQVALGLGRLQFPLLLAQHALAQRGEFELAEHLEHLLLVGGIEVERLVVQFHGYIGDDGSEALAHAPLFGVGTYVLLLLALQFIDALEHALQAAELLHQFHGGLLADPGNAGDVVHCIAHEAQDVLHLLGRPQPAPPLAHLLGAHDLGLPTALPGLVDHDPVGYELPEILIGRDHEGDIALGFGFFGQGADHIVGLEAIAFDHGDVEGLDDAADVGHVAPDVVGHFLPVGLVFGMLGLAGCSARIEDHGDVGGFFPVDQVQQRGGEPERGTGVEALAVHPWCTDEAEVGPVDQRVGIEQEEPLVGSVLGHGGKLRAKYGFSVPSTRPRSRSGPRP